MSIRFSDLIRRDRLVRDVRNRYPQTHEVFERFGVRASCWDCSLVEVAYRSGTGVEELMAALDKAILPRTVDGEEKTG